MSLPFTLPPVPASSASPRWTGRGFQVGHRVEPVLTYTVTESGWTDGLTHFHESLAGDRHYIDIASRGNSLSRLKKWVTAERPVIMDIGCSSGFLLRDIRKAFPHADVVGADYVPAPLFKLAQMYPEWPLIQFDLTTSPMPDECLDAASLANVLEHIEDDAKAMAQVYRMLRPGGVAVIEVPAGPHLFDVYDKQLLHFRRYHRKALRELLAGAGFEVHDESHIGFFLYPAFAAVKKRNKRYLSLPDEEQLQVVESSINIARGNPLMDMVMSVEEALRYKVPFPFGIRCVAVGRKPAI
ncbi:MAG TPA: class I SAM-dependent methyltransferase [Bryobacteraceae bacterium]|nr:class I SAM-dependent methyltransferase [Bryobacteraceae bacterium]